MDKFLQHYLIAAIWTATDDEGNTIDEFSISDFSADAYAAAFADCEQFQKENKELLRQAYAFYDESGMSNHPDAGSPKACAGHDFWLTRNGHGVGFWGRNMGEVGDRLTEAAKKYGEKYVYICSNGLQLGMD